MPSKKVMFTFIAFVIILVVIGFFVFFQAQLDKQTNRLHHSTLPVISEQAKTLHGDLFIGDWHSDSLMWNRNLMDNHDYGHVDIPRLPKRFNMELH
jgi:membrane dipeptidase